MKKITKIITTFIISFIMSINTLLATSNTSYGQNLSEVTTTYVNPLYEGENIETYSQKSKARTSAVKEFNTLEEGAAYLKEEMMKRSGIINFTLNNVTSPNLGQDLFNKAVEDNGYGNSSEGDYLLSNWYAYRVGASSNGNSTDLTFEMYYLSTQEQEMQVDKEVKKVLDELDVYEEDDYTKVKAVHDYIVGNIDYDFTYQNYSPYNAIVDKKVVCQGYAGITTKMLKELGVGVRFIVGNEGTHAWNIVKLEDKWYNIDNTWDACNRCYYGNIDYTYFLKGSSNFWGHTRNKEYSTAEFEKNFPTSTTSYVYKEKKSLSSATIKVEDKKYTGEEMKPSATVTMKDVVLQENKDYKVTYSNNIKVGSATVTITGMGNYKDSKTTTFNIKPLSFTKFTTYSRTPSSTYLSGYGVKGAKVSAYVNGKQIGKTVNTSNSGYYKINIPTQKGGTKITLKMSKEGYTTKEISTTVKKEFDKFTTYSRTPSSTYLSGYGVKGAKVSAYVNGKQIGKTVNTSNSGYYKINIPKQKCKTKITIKMTKTGYVTKEISTTVK